MIGGLFIMVICLLVFALSTSQDISSMKEQLEEIRDELRSLREQEYVVVPESEDEVAFR